MAGNTDSPSTAVERALSILEAVAERKGGLTNAEISRKLHLPKSSASYILRTLERRGYLRKDKETGKYQVGLHVLNLGRGALAGLDLRDVARPVLRHLMEQTKTTAHLAILDQGQAVYIEKVDAPGFVKMDTWIGRRLDIHTTGVGKALLSRTSEESIQQMLDGRGGLRKRTSKTIVTYPRLYRELQKVRAQGYSVDDEENNPGVRCVAAPVVNQGGEVIAAIGISGTSSQVPEASTAKIADYVVQAARQISKHMGYVR